jgi:aerobic C4-dicarboxylate transport protein
MQRLAGSLYLWVLVAICAGCLLGYAAPTTGVAMRPISDGFIALIKMLIAAVIFCTVVQGIAGTGNLKKLGRVGGKALFYFEVVSSLALGLGLLVANGLQPGAGFHVDPAKLDASKVSEFSERAHQLRIVDYILLQRELNA